MRPVAYETGHVKCGQGPGSCGWLGRVSLLGGEAQLAGCLKEPEGIVYRWSGTQASSDNAQGVIEYTVDEACVRAAAPDWCAVLGSRVDQRQCSCA